MPLAPERVHPPFVLRDAANTWLASLRILLLGAASAATAVVAEPWTVIAETIRVALTRVGDISQDEPAAGLENSAMRRYPHVLNAATNLLGICFIIIGGLKLTSQNTKTWSDEVAWGAAFFLVTSIVLSYVGIRSGSQRRWLPGVADWSFMIGIAALIVSMVTAAYQL